MDLGLQDRTTDLNLGEPRKYIWWVSGNVKHFRLKPQDKKTEISKLMLGNFFSSY